MNVGDRQSKPQPLRGRPILYEKQRELSHETQEFVELRLSQRVEHLSTAFLSELVTGLLERSPKEQTQ